jgi:glycine cleavage system H protein
MSDVPNGLKYTKEHVWVHLEKDIAIVGITDYAQHELTDIVFIELPQKGKKVEKGKNLATVESVKSVSDVFCPLSGEIVEVNQVLVNAPETINSDCYGKAWAVKIKLSNPEELKTLLSSDEYKKFIS